MILTFQLFSDYCKVIIVQYNQIYTNAFITHEDSKPFLIKTLSNFVTPID